MPLYNTTEYNQEDSGVSSQTGVSIPRVDIANSTTYIDLLGVLVGLDRIPGEAAADFAERIARAAILPRGADYIGLINELCLQLGFELQQAISIEAEGGVSVGVSLAGVHAHWGTDTLTVPITRIGPDDFWEWRSLSAVVADLNGGAGLTARLLIDDGPAFQLVRQTNLLKVIGESIEGQIVKLEHPGVVAGTQTFNQAVPDCSVRSNSVLFFESPVPAGTRVTYQYRVYPYSLLACPVFLIGLLDPELGTLAITPKGKLVYQMREFVQKLAGADRSYWAV